MKLGDEEDLMVFHKVILDSHHYLVVNDDDSNTADKYIPYVFISPACLESLNLPWPYMVRIKGPKRSLVTMLRDNHTMDQHIRVKEDFRKVMGIGRGEVVELEPCPDVQSGEVELAVTDVTRFGSSGPIDFRGIISNFLELCPGGLAFNQGFKFQVMVGLNGVFMVEFEVKKTSHGPACLVEKVEQVRVVEP